MATEGKHDAINDQEQQSILDACSSGNILALQQFFVNHRIQRGSKPVSVKRVDPDNSQATSKKITETNIPPTEELLERAVASRQVAIVNFILQTYPTLSLRQCHGVVRAILKNPDAEVLQALCNHDRSFASFSVDYGLRTFLTEACALPPTKAVPVLHVLLDNGGDVDDGWGPGGGALFAAITGKQPVEIINKILPKLDNVSSRNAIAAIRRNEADIVRALFSSGRVSPKVDVEGCIKEAKERENEEIIAIVQTWAQNRADGEPRSMDKGSRKKWWKFSNSRG